MAFRAPRVVVGIVAPLAVAALLAGCGSSRKPTAFDDFVKKYKCADYDQGSDGDIDMTCEDPQLGRRVAIQFEANDRPGKYFTEQTFNGRTYEFTRAQVEDSKIYDDEIDEDSDSHKKRKKKRH